MLSEPEALPLSNVAITDKWATRNGEVKRVVPDSSQGRCLSSFEFLSLAELEFVISLMEFWLFSCSLRWPNSNEGVVCSWNKYPSGTMMRQRRRSVSLQKKPGLN
ncbi:hypothetical protein MLD38_014451 [Melastoma candidum]|uniref:Uncharacterized protein n=1 Tax=Melastoma candidum TaxID=119954 RepID=A0ACB9RCG0_9MYRT|nr:hypothetical protein MLD38_014451 [Melastoma candidum]